jgi:HAE1 family hydrophobic/amphiphilic exporter-1
MAFAALVLVGVLAYTQLGANLYPASNLPYVYVTTVEPGAGPAEVERALTLPLEDALAGLPGLKHINATSAPNVSYLMLEFRTGVNADAAASDTERAIASIVDKLPNAAKPPIVQKTDFAGPIMQVSLAAHGAAAGHLADLAQRLVKPGLQSVSGVGQVTVLGASTPEVQVRFDPSRLEAAGVGVDQLTGALAAANLSLPAGYIDAGSTRTGVRLAATASSPAALARLPLAVGANGPVFVGDVADVAETAAGPDVQYQLDGQDSVAFVVGKAPGANTVRTSAGLRQQIDHLRGQLPPGVTLTPSLDSAQFIDASLASVQENLAEAIVLTALVLLLFLHAWRSTAIVLVAIPTSLLATYGVMYVAGFSLNQLTLLALALSIGVLVDDSIVVIENIARHLSAGKTPFAAALDARSEIGQAAVAITLVDVVVYTPLGFLTGIVGQFFREFGFTVVAAVLFSLVVSFTLTPLLASRWLGVRPVWLGGFAPRWDAGFERLEGTYRRVLSWGLHHRLVVCATSLVLVAISALYFPLHLVGTDFMPAADQGVINAELRLPSSATLAATTAAASALDARLRTLPDVAHVLTSAGTANETGYQPVNASNLAELQVLLKDRSRRRPIAAVLRDVQALASADRSAASLVYLPSTSGAAQPVVLYLRGSDRAVLEAFAPDVQNLVGGVPGAAEVTTSLTAPTNAWQLMLDPAALAQAGVDPRRAAATLAAALSGVVVGQLVDGRDVRVIAQPGTARSIDQLAALPVPGASGLVPLNRVAAAGQVAEEAELARRDRQDVVRVSASLDGSRSLGEVTAAIQERLAQLALPDGVSVELAGDIQLQNDSFRSFSFALGLGAVLMYMLMAALFGSLISPLAVMFAAPVALFGAFTALAMLRLNLGLTALIGLLMLVGLTAKNGILVVDFAERARKRGASVGEALLLAGPLRLRPVLMTSATVIVSMLPVALGVSASSEARAPMAAVVAGGMLSSTLLSLVLVPVVYSVLSDLAAWRRSPAACAPSVPDALTPVAVGLC